MDGKRLERQERMEVMYVKHTDGWRDGRVWRDVQHALMNKRNCWH